MSKPDWNSNLDRLRAWVEEHGHARVPQSLVLSDGFRLGKWVHNQRTAKRDGRSSMTANRIAALESVPGWTWNTKKTAASEVPLPTVTQSQNAASQAVDVPGGVDGVSEQRLDGDAFERRVQDAAGYRALRVWIQSRVKDASTPFTFTEDEIAADPLFAETMQAEVLRLTMAGLVAVGQITAAQDGQPCTWQYLVQTPNMHAGWTFRSAQAGGEHEPIPALVVELYEQTTETAFAL